MSSFESGDLNGQGKKKKKDDDLNVLGSGENRPLNPENELNWKENEGL